VVSRLNYVARKKHEEAFVIKRVFILIIGLISLLYLFGCSRGDEQNIIYGTFTFEKVNYLSPLSSSTKDYVNSQMEGTKYTIKEDLFKIESTEYTVEFSSPRYVKEEIPKDPSVLSDIGAFISEDVDHQYTIYDKDGNKTKWRLYVSSDYLWIGTYIDNTADGSEIIFDIYKLTK